MSKIKQMLDNLFNEKRKFSRFEACYDLDNSKGEIESLATLAKRWMWSKAKVQRFLIEMHEAQVLKKKNGKYKTNRIKKIQKIESIEVEVLEPQMEMEGAGYQIPMFSNVPPQRHGVPPTKEQALGNGGFLIDLEKVDWEQGMKTPLLRFYKLWLDKNPSYVVRSNDHDALKIIIRNLESIVRTDMKKVKKANLRFDRQVLKAVDRCCEAIQKTIYKGYDLKWISERWNQVMSAVRETKNK